MKPLEQQRYARQLYTQGVPRQKIAEQLGVSKTAVNNWTRGMLLQRKPCPVCDKLFRPKRTNQRYCSTKCSNQHDYQSRSAKPPPKRECAECGKAFQSRNDPRQLYCSKKCRDKVRNKLNYEKRKAKKE